MSVSPQDLLVATGPSDVTYFDEPAPERPVRSTGPILDPGPPSTDPYLQAVDESALAAIAAPLLRTAFMPPPPVAAELGTAIAVGAMPTAVTGVVRRTATVQRAAHEAPPRGPTPQLPLAPTNPWASAIAGAVGSAGAALSSLLLLAIFTTTAVAAPPRMLGRILGLATGSGSVGFAQAVHRPG
jgi:hypothetical protein